MEFIIEHWYAILVVVVVVAGGVFYGVKFARMTEEERYAQIRGWLLQAVLMAEKEFGSGTGKLKLSNVYAEFCKQLPWLAKVVSFEVFSKYVDDALVEMKDIIEKNAAIASVVETKGEN